MGRAKRYTIEVSKEEMIDWVAFNCDPEDVFSEDQLEEWAVKNGFVKNGERLWQN